MDWLTQLAVGNGIEHTIVVLILVVVLGLTLGRIKFFGISLGSAFVLFVGLTISCFIPYETSVVGENASSLFLDPSSLSFAQNLGLILFVYAIGIQSGSVFFSSFKKEGVKFNLIATALVFLGLGTALTLRYVFKLETPIVAGILSGAVTSTPSLGAAQAVFRDLGADENMIASAYTASYPLGVLGTIFSLVVVRFLFKIDWKKENDRLKNQTIGSYESPYETADPKDDTTLISFFLGILLGVVLAVVPFKLPGVPQPVKLGVACGPLIVALLQSAFGERFKLSVQLTPNVSSFIREFGLALFLACVGLRSGDTFISAIVCGDGLLWMALGTAISVVPTLLVGVVVRLVFRLDYFTLSGVIAGGVTNPPALAYATDFAKNTRPAFAYATVYPTAIILRLVTIQLFIQFLL